MPQHHFSMAGEISTHVSSNVSALFCLRIGVEIELQDQFSLLQMVL